MQLKYYHTVLLTLTRNLCDEVISFDDFKSALHELCTLYRKDKGINYVK